MSNVERAAEVAQAFHEAYERLAPYYGYKTREASAVPWDDVPYANKALMIATVKALADDGLIPRGEAEVTVEYGVCNAKGHVERLVGWTLQHIKNKATARGRRWDAPWSVVQRTVTTIRSEWTEADDD